MPSAHNHRRAVLLIATIMTSLMIVVMIITGAPLKTNITPAGILHLEFAYTATQVHTVLNAWTPHQDTSIIKAARLNTWLDFAFIISYSLLFYQLCRWIIKASFKLSTAGKWMAKASILAGSLDMLENTGMLVSMSGYITNATALFTVACAGLKWFIVILVVLFIIWGTIAIWTNKAGFFKHQPS